MTGRAAAVHNNADWCDAVCRALGCDTAWLDGLWLDRDPSPPYYPNAVSLSADGSAAQVERLRTMLAGPLPRPWSVKDCHCSLDLAMLGFEVLFEAEWIGLDAHALLPAPVDDLSWTDVGTDIDLESWEQAWRGANPDAAARERLFRPALLDDPDIRFLAGRAGPRIAAVAIANRSDDGTGPVVGISNIVLGGSQGERHRAGAVAAVRAAFPGLTMVGYERGDDLKAMLALGFSALGPLRVWLSPG
jgi:hypothetical protein